MSATQLKRRESPRSRLVAAAETYVRDSILCPDTKQDYEEEYKGDMEFLQYLAGAGTNRSFYRHLKAKGALPEFTLAEFIELWQKANDWMEAEWGFREEMQSEEQVWDTLFLWIVQEMDEHFATFT